MVGLDDNEYSDIALRWLLDELVDDGDRIICLRVILPDDKIASDKRVERKDYRREAQTLMEHIQRENEDNRSISITLEFAVGKLHETFQHMVCTQSYLVGNRRLTMSRRLRSMNHQC